MTAKSTATQPRALGLTASAPRSVVRMGRAQVELKLTQRTLHARLTRLLVGWSLSQPARPASSWSTVWIRRLDSPAMSPFHPSPARNLPCAAPACCPEQRVTRTIPEQLRSRAAMAERCAERASRGAWRTYGAGSDAVGATLPPFKRAKRRFVRAGWIRLGRCHTTGAVLTPMRTSPAAAFLSLVSANHTAVGVPWIAATARKGWNRDRAAERRNSGCLGAEPDRTPASNPVLPARTGRAPCGMVSSVEHSVCVHPVLFIR